MRQTVKHLRKRTKKIRQLYKIIRSVCRHRRTYLEGVRVVGKSLKDHIKL